MDTSSSDMNSIPFYVMKLVRLLAATVCFSPGESISSTSKLYCIVIPPLHRRGDIYTPAPPEVGYTVLPLFVRPSKIFFVPFFSATIDGRNLIFRHNLHIGTQYCGKCFWTHQIPTFYTHWTYMHIFRHIFLSNYWWQKSDIWSQASYRYPISWEAFFGPIRFLLPVCRLGWFLYTLNIYAGVSQVSISSQFILLYLRYC